MTDEPELLTAEEWEARKQAALEAEWAAEDARARESALQSGQLYELRIIASGEVRDADGNLLNTTTAESVPVIVTEAQALELMERQAQQ